LPTSLTERWGIGAAGRANELLPGHPQNGNGVRQKAKRLSKVDGSVEHVEETSKVMVGCVPERAKKLEELSRG
jgi:hypothetical protein